LSFLAQGFGVSRTLAREIGSPQRYFYYLTRFNRSDSATLAFTKGSTAKPPARAASTLSERQILDVEALSLPTLLRYEDSNSMFYSIESRMPFLDYRVVEFGLALPAKFKVRNGYGKWLLRKVAEPLLPEQIVWDRNKRAFSLDQSWWMAHGLAAILRAHVESPELNGLITAEFAKRLQDPKFYLDPNNFSKLTSLAWLMRNKEFWR
jgi:asparagine synthase (glutamine-hydrolysing)